MSSDLSLKETQKEWHGTLKSYLAGFTASLFLTAASFLLVAAKLLPDQALAYTVALLGLLQAVVQLRFFLHVGKEAKPRWELFIFYFMALVLLIIVLGSLWIMYDLNTRVMSNMEMPHD